MAHTRTAPKSSKAIRINAPVFGYSRAQLGEMDVYTMRCGGLTLTATQYTDGWISAVDGHGERRVAVKKDEDSAKSTCLQGATAMLWHRGHLIPKCLINPRWKKLRRADAEDYPEFFD